AVSTSAISANVPRTNSANRESEDASATTSLSRRTSCTGRPGPACCTARTISVTGTVGPVLRTARLRPYERVAYVIHNCGKTAERSGCVCTCEAMPTTSTVTGTGTRGSIRRRPIADCRLPTVDCGLATAD